MDCVTSNAGTFPIQQIQAGRLLVSRSEDGACCSIGPTCEMQTWTGPSARLTEILFLCNGNCNRTEAMVMAQIGGNTNANIEPVYHSCGNANGESVRNSNDVELRSMIHCASYHFNTRNQDSPADSIHIVA